MIAQPLVNKFLYGYALARSGVFKTEGILLPWVEFFATGKKPVITSRQKEQFIQSIPKVEKLLQRDINNIEKGYYPVQVLAPENAWAHITRIPDLFKDAFLATKRKHKKESHFFEAEAQKHLKKMPKYYSRNFHFQTSGYLGESSAELYDHQVEVLFAGTADPMRRQIIPALKKHFKNSNGRGLKFLELGSGTGRLTKFMALAFPEAQITCLDLSPVYLKKSEAKLKNFKNVKYVTGAAEKTAFKSSSFDAVYSCFLFHELPFEVREAVCAESYRILKKNGFFGLLDSLQLQDDPGMDWALKEFPKNFHEPFYKNYISKPMGDVLKSAHFKKVKTEIHFLAKVVHSVK